MDQYQSSNSLQQQDGGWSRRTCAPIWFKFYNIVYFVFELIFKSTYLETNRHPYCRDLTLIWISCARSLQKDWAVLASSTSRRSALRCLHAKPQPLPRTLPMEN